MSKQAQVKIGELLDKYGELDYEALDATAGRKLDIEHEKLDIEHDITLSLQEGIEAGTLAIVATEPNVVGKPQ